MKLSFIGDVMLGRLIGHKYEHQKYEVVSSELKRIIKDSDLVIANLESPLAIKSNTEGDHLQFKGNPNLLNEFDFVTLFSTANNHITDCGELGINETIEILNTKGFYQNGVFKDSYTPFTFENNKEKIAIVTLTDMLNIPFDKDSKWKVLRLGNYQIETIIKNLKKEYYYVILFAHVGMLFTRFPNPVTVDYLHKCADWGADLIVTSHSHCLGGMEEYNGKLIFHSIGDFCMDGNSKRRRRAGVLQIELNNGNIKSWKIIPTEVTKDLTIEIPKEKVANNLLNSYASVSNKIASHKDNYSSFFKKAYKVELLQHSFSTLKFIADERGYIGLIKMMTKRATEVGRTLYWMMSDRSKVQRDDDAIKANRKKISQEELFGK